MFMKIFFKKLLNTFDNKSIDYLSIQEIKEIKISKRKSELSKRFRKYVSDLNMKQHRWLKNKN